MWGSGLALERQGTPEEQLVLRLGFFGHVSVSLHDAHHRNQLGLFLCLQNKETQTGTAVRYTD